jgi:bla regulator protein BlaR1
MDAELGSLFSSGLLRSGIALSAGILLVLALRPVVRRSFGSTMTYRLWLIAPLAAAASLLPPPAGNAAPALSLPLRDFPVVDIEASAAPSFDWLLVVWSAGVIAAGLVIAVRQVQFLHALGKPSLDGDGLPVLRARDGFFVGPAVVGAFSPRIVLPYSFESTYAADEQRVILAHERAHLFGHDAQVNALAALLQCLNWFNPLVHIAARLFRIDQELAADAAVIRQFPGQEKVYAQALLKTQIATLGLPLGCQWPSRSEHPLRKRIALLRPTPGQAGRNRFGGMLLAALALAAGLAAWAATPRLAGEGAPVVLWTLNKSEGSTQTEPARQHAREGAWTYLTYTLPGGERYRVSLLPTVLPGGAVHVRAAVEGPQSDVETKPLVLESARPGLIHAGKLVLVVTAQRGGG